MLDMYWIQRDLNGLGYMKMVYIKMLQLIFKKILSVIPGEQTSN